MAGVHIHTAADAPMQRVRLSGDVRTALRGDDVVGSLSLPSKQRRGTPESKELVMVRRDQMTGAAALASGVLMTVGVEGEWLFDPQRDDGTVTNVPLLAVLMVTSTAGFVLLLTAVLGLRAETVRPTVPARAGALMAVLGAALMVAFGLIGLVSLLLTGSVLEVSFLAFLLGLLLLSVGTLTWGLSRRWASPAPGVRQLLLLSGASG